MDSEPVGVIARLMHELGKLPGVGPKSAERLTHYLLAAGRADVLALADALRAIKEQIHFCRQCCNPTENDLCSFCADARRDGALICVVEQPRDLAVVERSGSYRGLYHVLHGSISPLRGIGPEQLRIASLLERMHSGEVKELIVATNPTVEGEATAVYLSRVMKPLGVALQRCEASSGLMQPVEVLGDR